MELRNEWFAGWGTLALVNAGLAQSKHRSGLIWFLALVSFTRAWRRAPRRAR